MIAQLKCMEYCFVYRKKQSRHLLTLDKIFLKTFSNQLDTYKKDK